MIAMSAKRMKADIGVITIIPEELHWVREALGLRVESRLKVRSGRIYYFGNISALFAPRPYRVALTCIGEAGTPDCSATTAALIHECRPRLVLLVGIAAGIRNEVKIGSVVLSERVWDYEKGAVSTGRRGQLKRIPRPSAPPLPFAIQQDITHYLSVAGLGNRINSQFKQIGGVYPVSAGTMRRRDPIANSPEVLVATVASGNKLLRNPRFLQRLEATGHGRIKVGEMEAYGLFTACHQEATHWLVIRGVSDFGDKVKSDHYHQFAAQMAAAATRDFIERGLQLSVFPRRIVRRATSVDDLPSVAEMRKITSQLRTSSPPESRGPVAAKMLELSTPFEGRAHRLLRRREDLPSVLKPTHLPSRWTSQGGFLYLTLSAEDAVAEFLHRPDPGTLALLSFLIIAELDVQLSFVLNVYDSTVQRALDIDAGGLASKDLTYARSIAEVARLAGCEGLLAKNSMQRPMLVVFDRISTNSKVSFVRSEPVASLVAPPQPPARP